jgi:hypothetical protein
MTLAVMNSRQLVLWRYSSHQQPAFSSILALQLFKRIWGLQLEV